MRSLIIKGWVRVFLLLSLQISIGAQSTGPPSAYQEAFFLVQKQQFKPAIELLQKILAHSPNDLKALNLIGIALTASGRIEEANVHFQKAIGLNPKFYPALKNLALNEIALKRIEEAKAHLTQVSELVPNDPTVHLALGEIQFSNRQFEKAVKHYEQSHDLPFKDPHIALNFATSCLESNQSEKAVSVLKKLTPGTDAPTHFQSGLMYARLGKYEEAAQQFELARNSSPDPYQVSFNLTLAYVKAHRYPAAIKAAQDALAQGYQKSELYNLLSQAYEGNGQTVEAYDALRTATKLDPKDENNYLDLAVLCVDHANYDLGLEIVNIGIGNIPQSDRLHLQRGAILAMKGQSVEAAADFEKASQLAPQRNLPYVARGITLLQAGESTKAVELLRRRAAASPEDYLAHYILGEALNRDGPAPNSPEEKEAVRALEQSIRSNPNFPPARAALGKTLLRRSEVDRAIRELEKALELDPKDETSVYQLAQAYRRKGDIDRAQELFARVDRTKAEDREKFMNRTLLRLVREGSK